MTSGAEKRLDPAPRRYAPAVTLVRRSARGPAAAPATCTLSQIENWLLYEAAREPDMLLLFESFAWRMVAAGMSLDRASVHVGTLHPQLIGFSWNWAINDGFCDEIKVAAAALNSEAFTRSALYRVFNFGETVRRDPHDPAAQAEFPLMKELAEQGLYEYIAMPMNGAGTYSNAMTFGTKREGGFTAEQSDIIRRLLDLFALHVERHIALRIAENGLNAYLGETAATQVLQGTIRRGSGAPIRAIIWVSDLRGFTYLSGKLGDASMIVLLNAYFECLAGAVLDAGGDVLKFMGDGMLAVFPIGANGANAAATAAVDAAQEALRRLERLNSQAPPQLEAIEGWRPLSTGIALHEGEVFFGNIGAPDRLDFTVIGSAVNEASRVEAMQKTLGRNLLITGAAAQHLDGKLDDLGEHELRGVWGKMRIFSPATA